jgi:hypothetical protein
MKKLTNRFIDIQCLYYILYINVNIMATLLMIWETSCGFLGFYGDTEDGLEQAVKRLNDRAKEFRKHKCEKELGTLSIVRIKKDQEYDFSQTNGKSEPWETVFMYGDDEVGSQSD